MKIKKLFGLTVMAFTLSIGAFAGINLLSSSEKAEEVAATSSSTITVGAQRINVFIPKSVTWIFDSDAMIFSSGVSDSIQNFDFLPDTDIGTTTKNDTVRDFDDTYWIATKELPTDFTSTWKDFSVERHHGSDYWNKLTNHYEDSPLYQICNSYTYNGTEILRYGYFYKVALHTGLNHDNISYSLMRRNGDIADPESIPGYTFGGWYYDEACTTRYYYDLTGDANLYAKYIRNDFTAKKYAIVDGDSSNPILLEETVLQRGDTYEYPGKYHYPHHTFVDYWYTDPELTHVFSTVSDVEADINIYAGYSSTPYAEFEYDVDLNNSGWALGAANYAIRFETDNEYEPVSYCWSEYYTSASVGQLLLQIQCSVDYDVRQNNAILYRYNSSKSKADWDADKYSDVWNKTVVFEANSVFPNLRVGDTKDDEGNNYVYNGVPFVRGQEVGGEWDYLSYLDVYKINSANHVEAYNYSVDLTAGTQFKIHIAPYNDQDYYSDFTTHTLLNGVFTNGYGSNISVSESGTYAFFFDTITHNLHITKEEYIYADEWAASFLSSVTCSGGESGSIISDGWSTVSATYAALDPEVKAVFESIPTHGNIDGCDIEKAIARYDFILIKYGIGSTLPKHPDFIGRFSTGGVNENVPTAGALNYVFGFSNETTPIVLVVITAVVSLTTLGGLFYFRKRKEQ